MPAWRAECADVDRAWAEHVAAGQAVWELKRTGPISSIGISPSAKTTKRGGGYWGW